MISEQLLKEENMSQFYAKIKILIFSLFFIFAFTSTVNAVTAPPEIIYKTKANYDDLMFIQLSKDKSAVSSYTDPIDIRRRGDSVYPVKLSQGYLLDKRGIGPYSVFLDISYEKYSQLGTYPSKKEFFNMIKEYDPFLEMYACDYTTNTETEALNVLIDSGKLFDECDSILDPRPIAKSNELYFYYWMIGIVVLTLSSLYLILRWVLRGKKRSFDRQ